MLPTPRMAAVSRSTVSATETGLRWCTTPSIGCTPTGPAFWSVVISPLRSKPASCSGLAHGLLEFGLRHLGPTLDTEALGIGIPLFLRPGSSVAVSRADTRLRREVLDAGHDLIQPLFELVAC